jgi:2'-hydroxyisoflavone reductase
MRSSRRDFLGMAVGLGASMGLGGFTSRTSADVAGDGKGAKSILILGGTGFLGPHIVEAAQPRGHTITLFNRGKTNPHLFPDIEKLQGDRNSDLKSLEGRTWDAVVDTSGYSPKQVRESAGLLKDAVRQYVFISSISVYGDRSKPGMDETTVLDTLPDGVDPETADWRQPPNYGPMKALSEQAAEAAMPGRVTNIRPGLIVGPGDPSGRFTYWPVRVARGGEVLAPGTPDDPVQFIDARDLAEWIVLCIERNVTGIYNAAGPQPRCSMGELLAACKTASASDASFIRADAAFLQEQGVSGWSDMPAWVPQVGEYAGFGQTSFARAAEKGLRSRPVLTTVKDTLEWWRALPESDRKKAVGGIKPDREAQVLAALKRRNTETPTSRNTDGG